MRFAAAILGLALAVMPAYAGESAGDWLYRAADPGLSRREREFAARQVLMLADDSASIIVAAMREAGPENALRRQVAARLLGETALPTAEAPLLEAFFSGDPSLAEVAGASLAKIHSRLDVDALLARLRRGGHEAWTIPGGIGAAGDDWLALSLDQAAVKGRFRSIVMRGVARKYAEGGGIPGQLLPAIWDGLLDADREMRLYSIQAAGKSGVVSAGEKLASFLYVENDPELLIAALRALAETRSLDHGEAAERQAAHSNPGVAIEALATLDAMGYGGAMFPASPGARSIASFVSHPSTPIRRRAIELLGGGKNPAALEYLEAALFDRVGANRAAAVRALAGLGLPGAAGAVSPLLRDGWPETRTEAAVALAGMGVIGVAARVIDQLTGESLPFRRAAAAALGRIGDARAVPALAAALDAGDLELACLAAEALGSIGGSGAGAGLHSRLSPDADPALIDAIRLALGRIYRDDPGVSPESWKTWARRNMRSP